MMPTPEDLARDLAADLKSCEGVIRLGPDCRQRTIVLFAEFAAMALPAAIRRALAAEAKLEELREQMLEHRLFGLKGEV